MIIVEFFCFLLAFSAMTGFLLYRRRRLGRWIVVVASVTAVVVLVAALLPTAYYAYEFAYEGHLVSEFGGNGRIVLRLKKKWSWFPAPETRERELSRSDFESMRPALKVYQIIKIELVEGQPVTLETQYEFE